jgi:light-regulated signal transduction histidine kinase (bacteriophytochrome)
MAAGRLDSDLVNGHLDQKRRDERDDVQDLVYLLSHDLQEPLRMVAGFSQLVQRRYGGYFDEEAAELFGYVLDGVARMQKMVNGLVEFGRIESRRGILIDSAAEAAFDEAVESLSERIVQAEALITHDGLPTVIADPGQLRQVFVHLLENAIKFNVETPRIHVAAQRDDLSWVISVRDNGIGIDREDFQRLFRPFQRLHLREEYPGIGMGLALCRRIVERHGGRIWLESELGRGTTVYFSLPGIGDSHGDADER